MLTVMHRATVYRTRYTTTLNAPWCWVFECHAIHINGHSSTVYVCGEGTYRTWERAWKCLRQHALGKHDVVL